MASRGSHHILEKPAIRDRVIELVLAGNSDAQVATAVSSKRVQVTRQAIFAFRKRHKDSLASVVEQAAKVAEDYAIASRVNRVAALDDRWQRMKRLLEARAGDSRYVDEPGYDTGLMVHQLKAVGKGDDFQLVDLYVTDASLLAEMRATERAAAEELGQIQKAVGAKGGSASIELEDPNGNVVRFSLNLGSDSSHDEDD